MRRFRCLLIPLLLAVFLPAAGLVSHQQVMVLHSYQQGLLWADQLQEGLNNVLGPVGVDQQVMHLELNRHPWRRTDPAYLAYLEKTLQRRPPQLVLVVDNDALRYFTANRERLAPGVPVIFCGINNLEAELATRGPEMTGLAEIPSFSETFSLMRALQPGLHRVLVLGEKTATGLANRAMLEGQLAASGNHFFLDFHEEAGIERIEDRLRAAPDYDAIFLMCRPLDQEGYPLAEPIAGRRVVNASRVPVYSGWDFMLHAGVVGGVMVSGRLQGETAARLALRVLEGERAGSIPVLLESPNRAVVDRDGLDRFGIPRAYVPQGFEVLHDEPGLLELHGGKIAALSGIFLLLLLLVAVLVRSAWRRRVEAQVWQDTFNSVGDGICLLDAENRVVRVNRTMVRMVGGQDSPLEGRFCWEIVHGTAARCEDCPATRARASRQRERMDIRYGEFWYEVVVDPRFDATGRYLGAVHLMHDVSERYRSQEVMRSILDVAPYGVFDYELLEDGRLVFRAANRAADAILGVDCASFIGRTIEENFPALAAAGIPAAYRAVARDGSVYENEAVSYDERGISGAFDVRAVRIMPNHVGVFFRDVTERKKAEAALQAKTDELDRFFSVSLDLLCIAGLDGKIRRLNAQWEKVLGYPLFEVQGKAFLDFVHPADLEATLASVADLSAGRDVVGFINRYRAVDGSYRQIEWCSTAVGEVIYAAARDVTEQQQAQAALRESEARFRNLFESMREGVVYHAADGSIIEVNPAAERILGLSREQLIGRSSIDPRWRCLHEDGSDYPGETHPAMVALRTGEPVLHEVMGIYVPEQDRYHWAVVNAVPVPRSDQEGGPVVFVTIGDITELKAVSDRMRETNESLRRSQQIAHVGDWKLVLADGSFQASEEALALLGFLPDCVPYFEEVAGLIDPEDRPRAHEALEQLVATGEPYSIDIRFRRRDTGETTHVLSMAELQRDAAGRPIAVFGINQDISERKRAENALREGEHRFHSLFDNMAEGVALHTVVFGENGEPVDYVLVDANSRYEKITGVRVADVRGRRAQEVYGTEAPPFLGEFTEVALSGIPCHLERYFEPMDRHFEISVAPWGERGFATIFSDVSARKRAEQALVERERQLRSVVENVDMVFYSVDRDGMFLFSEGRGLAALGLSPGEVVGRSALEMYEPFPEVLAGLRRAIAGERFSQAAPLGNKVFEIFYTPVTDVHGSLSASIGVAVNVTERVQAERERERLIGELEAKNAELERFTYTVSHDLKSPLITIKGFVGILQGDIDGGDAALVNKDLQRIAAAADRMQDLLEDLLELSRIGRIVNPPVSFAMGEVVREALEMLDAIIRERAVFVEMGDQWPVVRADRVRIREVWQNLIENAVKYMGEEAAPRISLGHRVVEGESRFFMADNGIGIESRYRERVFRLFEKLDPSSEGTGIGLALVARIVELHGGRIDIDDGIDGKGTTVWFTLAP